MHYRLKLVIGSILDLPADQIGEDASPTTISTWDSMKQIQVMLAVEEEFRVQFSDDQIHELTSYRAILEALKHTNAS